MLILFTFMACMAVVNYLALPGLTRDKPAVFTLRNMCGP